MGARSLGWMSPDELILMLPAADLADVLDALADALAGLHHLVVDVSDMRAMFQITGPRADQVLMKLTPADVAGVAVGELRRSRLSLRRSRVLAGGRRLATVCFRSVAVYMRDLLDTAALVMRRPGSAVGDGAPAGRVGWSRRGASLGRL